MPPAPLINPNPEHRSAERNPSLHPCVTIRKKLRQQGKTVPKELAYHRERRETIHQQTEVPSSSSQKPHKTSEGINADSETDHQKLQQGNRIKQPDSEENRPQPTPSSVIPVTEPPQTKNSTGETPKKKKLRKGKIPLRLRSSILERLHKYQMKIANERNQAKNQM